VLADKADTVRIIRELRFLRLLQHPNIIAVHDVLLPSRRKDFDAIFIVFERLDTDLASDPLEDQIRRGAHTGAL
jgi:serine/threonine protein kinase